MDYMNHAMPIRFTANSDSGRIEGYGSVFDELHHSDVIVNKGAFAKTLAQHRKTGSMPAMLWQHDMASPVGVWETMTEDARGLKVTGRLLIDDVAQAKEAHALLKAGALRGLSIGFYARKSSYDEKTGIRFIDEADLVETSIVTSPNCPSAQVAEVHGRGRELIRDIRGFEKFLRDAGLFSRSDARRLSSLAKTFFAHRDDGETEAEAELFGQIKQRLEVLSDTMKS